MVIHCLFSCFLLACLFFNDLNRQSFRQFIFRLPICRIYLSENTLISGSGFPFFSMVKKIRTGDRLIFGLLFLSGGNCRSLFKQNSSTFRRLSAIFLWAGTGTE